MSKQRILILTGSGAAMPWKGPTTDKITKKLISDKTFKTVEGRPVGEYIYNNILENSYKNDDDNFNPPNFENIIDAVEYLADYFYGGSILTRLFDVTGDIKNQILAKHAGETIKFREERTFFETLLNRFYEIITEELSYSRWWEISNKRNERINSSFKDFIEFYTSLNSIVRYYTVNYDRLAEFATKLKFFNGFTPHKFNLKKIIEDDEVLCHYNLHGSVFFKRDKFRDWHCDDTKQEQPISFYNSYKNQRRETIFESNITTGLNKISGILEAPWQHFYHKFYNDCWNADAIYSIGYSFSDIHINKAIGNFIDSGKGRLIIIDKIEKVEDEYYREREIRRATRNLSGLRFPHGNIADIKFKKPDGNGWITDDDLKLRFYCNGFKKFLSERQWTTCS